MIRQQLIALLSKTGDNDTEVYMRGNNSFIIPITDAIIMGDGSGKDEICLIDGDVEISIDKAMIDLKEQADKTVYMIVELKNIAKQEDSPFYEGDKETDSFIKLSDVLEVIEKYSY